MLRFPLCVPLLQTVALLLLLMWPHSASASKVTDLHTALSPETLDVATALTLIHSLDQHEVDIPIYGERPLLHHALNLYFMSQIPKDRSTLVDVMHALIDKHIDINAPYNSDPDVVFKTIVIRELGLAYALAGGGGLTNNSISLTQLYSVPCDPIPLSKLLLHAHSVVQTRQAQTELHGPPFTVEQVKVLLAGASLGSGAKPAAKATDLYTHSPSFVSLLEQMVAPPTSAAVGAVSGLYAKDGFSLQTIIDSLGELGSIVHMKLLQNFLAASVDHVEGLGHLANLLATFDKKGRNPLHTLAMSGSASLVQDLVTTFSALDARKSKRGRRVRGKLAVALSATDIRGHTPIAYAALRYGPVSRVYKAFRALAVLARAEVDEMVMEYLFSSHERFTGAASASASSNVSDDQKLGDDGRGDGGWSQVVLEEGLRGDPIRCDILEVWSGQPLPVDFFVHYIALGKPVIFRNALQLLETGQEKGAGKSIRAVLNKTHFLMAYGEESIPVSTIPYASSFGVNMAAMSLREVADLEDKMVGEDRAVEVEVAADASGKSKGLQTEATEGENGGKGAPLYAFSTALPRWRGQIEAAVGLPQLLEGGELVKDVEMQFYLGQAGTGAPMHYHGHAVNSLAYGEKKWFMLPPTQAFYSKTPSLEYANSLRAREQQEGAQGKGDGEDPLQCTQRAGDLMYVPTLWGHATLNTKQSIGVAHEFSVDDICME